MNDQERVTLEAFAGKLAIAQDAREREHEHGRERAPHDG